MVQKRLLFDFLRGLVSLDAYSLKKLIANS